MGRDAHFDGVARLRESYAALPPGAPVRLAKRTSNLFRGRSELGAGLDVSGLAGVIEVDGDVAEVQGMCTYEHLVEVTLAHGRIPLVVPQLRTITLGGAVSGPRHRVDQLPQRAAARVGARDGRADRLRRHRDAPSPVTTSSTPSPTPTARSATRPGCGSSSSASRRTSRSATSASTTPRRWRTPSSTVVAEGEWDGERVDGLDGVAFTPGELYLTLARWTDEPGDDVRLHRAAGLLPLAPAARDRPADHARLPLALGHRLVLVLAGLRRPAPRRPPAVATAPASLRRLLAAGRTGSALRHRRPARPARRPAAGRARGPGRRGARSTGCRVPRWFDAEVGMRPVWLCPLRLRRGGS